MPKSASSGTKRVLFFGMYDRTYARTKVLQNGFTRNGWKIHECHADPRTHLGVFKYWKLFVLGMSARRQNYDVVIVGFPGHLVVWIARLLFGPKIVFDAFLSNYDANLDRKLYAPGSWRARKDIFIDTWSCRLAGTVLLDTNALKEYFVRQFGIPREKCIAVPISADDTVFFPMRVPEEERFTVHFHGTFIPLQGVAHIIDAANILRDEDIFFRIVGSGQESTMIERKIQELNLGEVVERINKVPVDKIPGYMAGSHVVLGIFGDVERAKRAVPNKVYEAMAMGKAIITADTAGMHELPNPEKAFMLVPPGNPQAIAEAIRVLKHDEVRRRALAVAARKLFEDLLLPEKVVANLLAALGR